MASPGIPTRTGAFNGTGAALTINTVGFAAKYIKFINEGTGAVAEFSETMDADTAITHDTGTDGIVTSQGVTLELDGFSLGTNPVINGSGNRIHWVAFG